MIARLIELVYRGLDALALRCWGPEKPDFWPPYGADVVVDDVYRVAGYRRDRLPATALGLLDQLRQLGHVLGERGDLVGQLEALDLQDARCHGCGQPLGRDADQARSGALRQVPNGAADPAAVVNGHVTSPRAGSGTGSVGEAVATSPTMTRRGGDR